MAAKLVGSTDGVKKTEDFKVNMSNTLEGKKAENVNN